MSARVRTGPDAFGADGGLFIEAERRFKGGVRRTRDPREAVLGADVVYTNTWTSVGQEKDAEWLRAMFAGFQVNEELMSAARPNAPCACRSAGDPRPADVLLRPSGQRPSPAIGPI